MERTTCVASSSRGLLSRHSFLVLIHHLHSSAERGGHVTRLDGESQLWVRGFVLVYRERDMHSCMYKKMQVSLCVQFYVCLRRRESVAYVCVYTRDRRCTGVCKSVGSLIQAVLHVYTCVHVDLCLQRQTRPFHRHTRVQSRVHGFVYELRGTMQVPSQASGWLFIHSLDITTYRYGQGTSTYICA